MGRLRRAGSVVERSRGEHGRARVGSAVEVDKSERGRAGEFSGVDASILTDAHVESLSQLEVAE